MRKPILISSIVFLTFAALISSGCARTEAKPGAPQAMPVKVQTISLSPVPHQDEYVATVKSRRSASIQPQVDGSLTRILVKSGDHVRAGQVLMTIDPLKQQATATKVPSTPGRVPWMAKKPPPMQLSTRRAVKSYRCLTALSNCISVPASRMLPGSTGILQVITSSCATMGQRYC